MPRLSLQAFLTRLIWVCVLPLMFLAVYLAANHVQILREQHDQEAADRVRNIAAMIDRQLGAHIATLQVLAASPLLDDPAHLSAFHRQALGFRENLGAHVILADRSMQMLLNTRVPLGQALPKLPRPRGHAAAPAALETGKPAVGDIVPGPVALEPLIAVAVPVQRGGEIRHLLLSTIETRQFQQQLDELAFPDGWHLRVLDSRGNVIARRASSQAEDPAANGFVRGRHIARSSVSPWSVALDIRRDVYQAPIVATAAALAVALLAALLLGVLGGRFATRRLTRSVASLTDSSPSPPAFPAIAEIEAARKRLDDAAAARRTAETALRESEERLRLATEAARIGTWDWDIVANRVRWDEVLLRLFGLEAGALSDDIKAWLGRVHPEDRPRLDTAIRNTLHDRAHYAEEFRVVTPGGEMRWIAAEGQAFGDAPGPAVRMIGVARDVTERRQAEEALRESEARLRNVLDSMFPFVGLISLDGRVLEANRAPLEAAGLAREDVIGRPCAETWWFNYSPAVQERLRAALARASAGEAMRYDETICIAGGRFITIDLMFSPLRDGEGRISAIVGSATDITDRKRAEETLKSNEERLRLTVQAGNVGLWHWDLGTNQVTYSREWKGQLGYSDHEIGNSFREWESRVHPDDLAPTLDRIQAYLARPAGLHKAEFRMHHKDGSWRWILAHGQVFHDPQGRPDRMMGCHIDITDRKKAELASRSERDFSESVLNSLPGVFYCYDESRRFLRWNRNFEEVTGYSGAEIARMTPLDFFSGADRDLLAARIEEVFDKGISEVEADFVARNGSGTPYYFTGLAAEIEGRRCLVGVGIDISARKRAEAELHEMSRRLIEAEEAERRNINRELHDRIGQNLSALGLNLGLVRARAPGGALDAVGARLDDMEKLIESTSRDVRDIMAELRPPALDDYGLLAALRIHAKAVADRAGMEIVLRGADPSPRPSIAIETALFRIAQEALNNVVKHARAARTEIVLAPETGKFTLVVSDDGAGLDPASLAGRASWGMSIMRERAMAVGAAFRVESSPGSGTRVIIELAIANGRGPAQGASPQ